jgi:hypothetical protein
MSAVRAASEAAPLPASAAIAWSSSRRIPELRPVHSLSIFTALFWIEPASFFRPDNLTAALEARAKVDRWPSSTRSGSHPAYHL